MDYIGLEFLDYGYFNCKVILPYKDNCYLVKNSNLSRDDGVYCGIMSHEEIDKMLSIQNELKEGQKRSVEREEQEKAKQEKQEKEKADNENLYGFADNQKAIQKGKILKCLMEKISYKNKIMSRKEYVIFLIKEGWIPEIYIQRKYDKDLNIKEKQVYALGKDNLLHDVNKTMYDFANYIITNNAIS